MGDDRAVPFDPFSHWLPLLLGIAIGALPPLWLRRRPVFGVDAPGASERKLQRDAIPLVGAGTLGLALLLLLLGATIVREGRVPFALCGAALVSLLLGIVDDRKADGLRAGPKLLLQLGAGVLTGIGVLWPVWRAAPCLEGHALLVLFAAAFVVVLLQNAWNFFDNFDGAALWTAGAASVLWLASPGAGGAATTWFLPLTPAAALLFPILGLLLWNWPRARCYLGDAGSHVLGLVFAWAVLSAGIDWVATGTGPWPQSLRPALEPAALLRALLLTSALPLVDLAQVSLVRLCRGIPPWEGDRRHLAHRLARVLPGPCVAPVLAPLHALLALGAALALS